MTMSKLEEAAKDIGLKLGSKEKQFWTDVIKKCNESIITARHDIELNEHILILCDDRIEEEDELAKE